MRFCPKCGKETAKEAIACPICGFDTVCQMSLEEQKQAALGVLEAIDAICRENGFAYSLAYGTLLGAVRHGGFIPWDDDIDIMMPRADYLRFVEYCKNHGTSFALASAFTDPGYGYVFAKACDTDTVVITDNMRWRKNGVQVDIFPIENLGGDKETAKKRFRKRQFQREMLVAWNWKWFGRNKRKSIVHNAAKLMFFLASRFASNKALLCSVNDYYGQFTSEECAYAGIVCGAYRMREIMPADVYREYTDILFEGKTFRSITKYDEYLTITYGDYMQLPPVEKRVTHHNFKAYRP